MDYESTALPLSYGPSALIYFTYKGIIMQEDYGQSALFLREGETGIMAEKL